MNTLKDTDPKPALLSASDIRKSYGPNPVLKGVSFNLHAGEIVGFVGHNGAGKSTLLKVFAGAHKADSGTLKLAGRSVSFSSPQDAIAAGVSTVYQELSLLPNLTVTQNVWLGRELAGPTGLRTAQMRAGAQEIVERFGLDVDVDKLVGAYPVATRQLLEIAIAVSKDTKCLLLDEPTTALEGEQITHLLSYLRNLADTEGIGILLVNHKLDELYQVCDRIVALMDGRLVIDAPTATANRRDVVAAIAGQDAVDVTGEKKQVVLGERVPWFGVEDLVNDTLGGVSFDAARGRVLGVYGLGGSGRSETLRAIVGADRVRRGRVRVGDETFAPTTPRAAIRRGIAFLTEERKTDGIVPQQNSVTNTALPVLERFTSWGVLRSGALDKYVNRLLEFLELRGDPQAPISSLSGGNQQKVLLAKALAQEPKVLLLDEPTKGVDIGVKTEIHQILRDLAHTEDMVVVMVSSEEEEILDVSDEVIVFAGGRVVSDPLPVDELSVSKLRHLAWSE
ncbi:sugar ABC transporter ATP-binding protein [Actinomyces sp. F1_1611]